MKRDGSILGWGMSGAAWISGRFPAQASVELRDDGSARVACGTQDIGTGTYTILAQLVSDKTGVPLNKIEVVLGDTSLPPGPVSGGSLVMPWRNAATSGRPGSFSWILVSDQASNRISVAGITGGCS